MSRLDPSVVPLDKGLNLQTAKILAPAGSALSSLNYEQVDFQGQKRIDGYTRYDGNVLSAIDEYYLVPWNKVDVVAELVYVGEEFLGRMLPYDDEEYCAVAVYNFKLLNTLPYTSGTEFHPYDEHYSNLLSYNQYLRNLVESLPGAIAGLHWFNDRLYAVADMAAVELNGLDLDLVVGHTVQDEDENFPPRQILGLAENENFTTVFLSGPSITEWKDSGVVRIKVSETEEILTVASYAPTILVDSYLASFYESRTEVQATLEDSTIVGADFGWKFKHLGWEVKFDNGMVPYGGLTSVNQNKEGVGIQGPTSIAGNNGRPLTLAQKIKVADGVQQVNGWKTSGTPASYNLDPLALSTQDSSYVYADCYVTWNADTQNISTPDITTAYLNERAASSSVNVEIP